MGSGTKNWTGLGFATLLVGTTGLSACGEQMPREHREALVSSVIAAPQPVTMPQGGEGEGGVAIEMAAYDRTVYLTAIAIAKAHVLAARDAYAAGEREAASEMYGHPAAEVLMDMEPIFEARGVALFTDQFLDTSDAVLKGAEQADIDARTRRILATLAAAAKAAPPSDKDAGVVAAAVVADQIDRAADMYNIAKEVGTYGPYLDGYGFLEAAKQEFRASRAAIAQMRPELSAIIEETIQSFGQAYPSAVLPAEMPLEPAALLAQASRLKLSLS